jgi:hypothetical protein
MKTVGVLSLLTLLLATAPGSLTCARANETSEERQLSAARADQFETSRLPALEQQVLGATRGRAERQGDQLILVLLDGSRKAFQSQGQCPAGPLSDPYCLQFYLVAWLPSRHAFIVCAAHLEEHLIGIVDDRSGGVSKLASIPYFSPTAPSSSLSTTALPRLSRLSKSGALSPVDGDKNGDET